MVALADTSPIALLDICVVSSTAARAPCNTDSPRTSPVTFTGFLRRHLPTRCHCPAVCRPTCLDRLLQHGHSRFAILCQRMCYRLCHPDDYRYCTPFMEQGPFRLTHLPHYALYRLLPAVFSRLVYRCRYPCCRALTASNSYRTDRLTLVPGSS